MTTAIQYNDKLAIIKIHEQVRDAFNAGELEKLLEVHSEDVVLMENGAPSVSGKSALRPIFEKFFHNFSSRNITLDISFDIVELEVDCTRAFVRGRVFLKQMKDGENVGQNKGKFVSLLKKQAGGDWLRTHVIANSDESIGNGFPVPQH